MSTRGRCNKVDSPKNAHNQPPLSTIMHHCDYCDFQELTLARDRHKWSYETLNVRNVQSSSTHGTLRSNHVDSHPLRVSSAGCHVTLHSTRHKVHHDFRRFCWKERTLRTPCHICGLHGQNRWCIFHIWVDLAGRCIPLHLPCECSSHLLWALSRVTTKTLRW